MNNSFCLRDALKLGLRKCGRTLWLFAFIGIAALSLTSCSKQSGATKPPDVDYYTCTMHPSVRLQDPNAKCPLCGMSLVPVKKKSQTNQPAMGHTGHDHSKMLAEQSAGQTQESIENTPSDFVVPMERQQQIGVTYATVTKKPLHRSIRTVGTVTYDKQRHWDFVARVEGYVQKLQVSSRGELVEKGQPLMSIYSPDLLTTQQEFLDLLRMRDQAQKSGSQAALESAERLIESAKRRFQLWNITTNQIAELERSRKPTEALTLFSPFKGIVQDLAVDQGRRVSMGDHLVDIADLSTVWVWAEFYQDEIPLLKKDSPVTITSASLPNEKFTGKIAVVDPFVNEATRTARVRLEISNPDLKLQPDMYVDVELDLNFGEGLTVPVNAVMPTGQHNIVFVDRGEGKLEPRFVELGKKFGGDYVINKGLQAGERVVNSANFLVDAEAKIQGALKSW
ncbi:MAG: Efflux transporter, family, subunit [Pedosphaera sp.]|nr:Efflux transporter, family, subunit [Pedosphaera sp.]